MCETFKNVQGEGTKIIGSAFIPYQAQRVAMKTHQRHHLRDKSLLNFNFLAGSLLACGPSLTKSFKGVELKQDTDIHTPSILLCSFISIVIFNIIY